MAEEAGPGKARSPAPARDRRFADSHWAGQFWVTVVLVIAFLALAGALIWQDKAGTSAWQRLDSVFGVVGAITLTAVGWLFGREVHRGEARAARRDANQSKNRLDVATTRLTARTGDVIRLHTKLTTLAEAVMHAPPPTTPDRGWGGGAGSSTARRPSADAAAKSALFETALVGSPLVERVVDRPQPPPAAAPPEDGLAMLRALAASLITDEPTPGRGGVNLRSGRRGRRGGGNPPQG
jgi:hypothetical protein